MIGVCQGTAGMLLAAGGWMLPRWVAGARRLSRASLLDAAPVAFVAIVLFAASGRPIFAGAVVFALGAGFAFADRTLRATLCEPVVFTALSELPQVFTHPHLYLPFAGTGLVIGGAAAALAVGFALLIVEPSVMQSHLLIALTVAGAVAAGLYRVGREPSLGRAAGALRRLDPSGEPFADAARLGPAAMLIIHGIIARAERPARRAGLPTPAICSELSPARPIVLVQCESFFDARRALPDLPRNILSGVDAAAAAGRHGRLIVPAWGANTMRAEFAVLTGIAEEALGYDRFNPYHALARQKVPSQVWRLRQAGYRTICLHPFDRRFFRRDLTMPALGFDMFLGRDTLGGSRTPPYMSDPDLARQILRVLDTQGQRTFIFAITMGNHGPWFNKCPPPPDLIRGATSLSPGLDKEDVDGRVKPGQGPVQADGELSCYLDGLRRSDEMLRILVDGLERRGGDPLLGFYGDHLPSLPRDFARLGFEDWRSDYLIWGAGQGPHRDLHAHELGRVLVDFALAPRHGAPRDAVVAEPHGA